MEKLMVLWGRVMRSNLISATGSGTRSCKMDISAGLKRKEGKTGIPKVEILSTAEYVYSDYALCTWETNYRMSSGTHWTHCELDLS